MKFNPPIEIRPDKDLFEITSNTEDWDSEAVLIAKKELLKRGYSSKKIDHNESVSSKSKEKIEALKRSKGLSKKELIILILCAPYIFISMFSTFLPRIGKTVMELENEGFHKLKWQRLAVLTLANTLWFFVLSVWLKLF
ncbi:MAG: hypothetical protein RIE52_13525 [Balneola sp.]|jgi:hypothetical protein